MKSSLIISCFLQVIYLQPLKKVLANLSEKDPHRADMLWGYLRGVKKPGTSELAFGLFSVAEVVMNSYYSSTW